MRDVVSIGGFMDGRLRALHRGWQLVNFTLDKMISSTFVERLSTGGCWIGSSSVQ